MSLMLSGTGVSRGIAIGTVRLLHEIQHRATASHVAADQVATEIERLTTAMHAAITELRELQSRLETSVPSEVLGFFDSHLLMLEDEMLSQPVIDLIRNEHYSSEWALAMHRDSLVQLFSNIEDAYLQQRAEDVENVIAKVLGKLAGTDTAATAHGGEHVVVTRSIAPADVIAHQHDGMRGLICTHGGAMSHAAIVARSLRIPTIVGAHSALTVLRENDAVIVDGGTGMIVAAPDKRSLQHYRRKRSAEKRRQRGLRSLIDKPTRTRDGTEIELLANVDNPADATTARRLGAAGVGMFRTETLYLNRDDLPDEREQLAVYRRLLRSMRGRPVTIRTMDVWAGGTAYCLPRSGSPPAAPSLGQRGVRLSLAHPELFVPQLRAMLRASTAGPLRILLPMVTTPDELRAALAMLERAREEVGKRYSSANTVKIGVLVEVPAVALACRLFVPQVDFLAIGTNDLAQYTLAVDRDDDKVQHLYDPLHPAVLRLIRDVVKAGHSSGKPVVLCGELASDARMCRLLLGLGLRHLSVHPASLLDIKEAILNTDVGAITPLARRALHSDSPARTQRLLNRINDAGR